MAPPVVLILAKRIRRMWRPGEAGLERLLFAAALTVGTLGACFNLDGFSGGAVEADASGPADSSANASSESGPPPAKDAATGPDGAASRPDGGGCPTGKTIALCEEFTGDPSLNGWQAVATSGGTVRTTANGTEDGLLATVPAQTTGDAPLAYWQKAYGQTISHFALDVDLQYDAHPANPGEYQLLFTVRLDHATGYHLIYLSIPNSGAGYAVQDFPSYPNNIDYRVIDVTAAQRHHVHVDVTAGGQSRLAVDGTVLQDNPTPAFVVAGKPTVLLGVTFSSGTPSSKMTVAYEHLVFTAD